MNDNNLPVLPPREERRRDRSDRRDPVRRDRRRADRRLGTRIGPDRRRGPRRAFDRRRRNILGAFLATFLCMLCLAAPPDLHADNTNAPECVKPAVMLEFFGRSREAKALSLALCNGEPNRSIIDEFSIHLRPRGARRPSRTRGEEREGFVARDIRRFDVRLLSRLQSVAERWPDRRIVVVSAYRPSARVGSRHHHAQAIDIRVEGVHRAEVAEFARALPQTGVGFYPVSTFTHIDVRTRESFWVDESMPGQRSRYVPGDREDAVLAEALAALPSRQVPAVAAAVEAPVEPRPEVSPVATMRVPRPVPAVAQDVRRTVREGLRGAFDLERSAREDTDMNGEAPADVTASATPVPPAAPAPPPAQPAPIDWSAPW